MPTPRPSLDDILRHDEALPTSARAALDQLAGMSLVESVLDVVSFGLIVLDARERVVLWSRWLEGVSGVGFAAARGRELTDIFPELAATRVMSAVQGALRDGFPSILSQSLNKAPFPLFAKISPREGRQRIQQKVNVLPLRSAGVEAYCLIEIFDVSLAVRRENALGGQKKFLNTVLESEPECVKVIAPGGKVLQMNQAGLGMLEVDSVAAIQQRGLNTFILPVHREAFAALGRRVFEGETGKLEFEVEGARGTRRWLETHAAPLRDAQGQVTAVLAVTRDISERRQQRAVDAFYHEIDRRVLQGQSRQDLLSFICAESARIFDYPVVWIGRKKTGGALAVMAHGGAVRAYLPEMERIGIRWDETPFGDGPAGSSIRTGQTQYCRASDASFAPWRELAAANDLHAFLSIPLILRGDVYGCFVVGATEDGSLERAATVQRFTDIAARICVALERAMDHEQMRLLQSALATAANGVFITDRQGRIQWLNAAFVKMTGYSEEEALGATPRLLLIGNDASFFQDMLQSIATGEAWTGETVESRKDGGKFNVRQTITPIRDADGETTHFISILEDITATRTAEATLQRLAHYDNLTDLPNRVLFNDRFQQAMAFARRGGDMLALLFLDLDNFKAVNDSYGHDVGDLLLQEVARRLKSCVRESDTVARLAGDEFTILLPRVTGRNDAVVVAEKILAAFATPFVLDGFNHAGATSIGIAVFPDDADSEVALLKCADMAMYAAKRLGSNRFLHYRKDMDKRGPA